MFACYSMLLYFTVNIQFILSSQGCPLMNAGSEKEMWVACLYIATYTTTNAALALSDKNEDVRQYSSVFARLNKFSRCNTRWILDTLKWVRVNAIYILAYVCGNQTWILIE